MTDYLFFLLLGVAAGAIIASFGLGLLVTHQGSGVINFGFGGLVAWNAYVYSDLRHGAYPWPLPGIPARLHIGHDVGVWWAIVLTLLVTVALMLRMVRGLTHPLSRAVDVAEVLRNRFMPDLKIRNIAISTEQVKTAEGNTANVSALEVTLVRGGR